MQDNVYDRENVVNILDHRITEGIYDDEKAIGYSGF